MSPRLTRDRWVEEGLAVLRAEGPDALAADRMAKRLGVSRGSFYWHFANGLDFEAAVLGVWEERWTTRIVAAVSEGDMTPAKRLQSLIEKTGGLDASIYAAAKRMAHKHPDLSILLERVDSTRVNFVTGILMEAGLPKKLALPRARIVYAWAMGQMLISSGGAGVPREISKQIVAFAVADVPSRQSERPAAQK